MVSPARRRDAVRYLTRRHPISERRACKLVGQHRSTQRYQPLGSDFELRLVARINDLAVEHPRFGYRRIHALLRAEGWEINRKRVERLWRLEGHKVPQRKGKQGQRAFGSDESSAWSLPAERPNHIWSYDFVATRTANGGALRILNIVDEFTRRCVFHKVDRSIGTNSVIDALEVAFERHGRPEILRSDNGKEFTSTSLAGWLKDQGVAQAFIEKGSPQQNPYVERFNGSMRDEVLSGEIFHSLLEARTVIAEWVDFYNTKRPHRGLEMKTPEAFYAEVRVVAA